MVMNGENGILKNQFHIATMYAQYAQYRRNGGNNMAIRRNVVFISGRIEWRANDVRNVTFQNGSSETFYKVRISSKRNTKKDAEPVYDSFYVEFSGKDAFFAKKYLNVGNYIAVEGECMVNSSRKDVNGITVYEEMYTIKVREFNASKGLYLNENEIRIMGYLAKDPKVFAGAVSSVAITVIVNRKGGSTNSDTFNVKVFGKSAEYVQKHFRKGNAIAVDGRMQPAYFKDGVWHNNAEIVSNYVRNPLSNINEAEPADKPVETRNEAPAPAPAPALAPDPIPTSVSKPAPAPAEDPMSDFDNDILSGLGLDLNDISDLFG
jgi:single-stranded DNA-binding protein